MTIGVFGAEGAMGQTLVNLLTNQTLSVVSIDFKGKNDTTYTQFDDIPACDVIIDFSHHSLTEALLTHATKHNVPLVIATTNHTQEEQSMIEDAAKSIPIFMSANMAYGVHLFATLLKEYAHALEDAYDIEMIETHHKHKTDAPSGTAYYLANSLNKGLKKPKTLVTDRMQKEEKRTRDTIGMSAVRGGSVVGEHTVLFLGESDTLEFTHRAHSKQLFAEGALKAAHYIKNQTPRLYGMDDLINERRKVL